MQKTLSTAYKVPALIALAVLVAATAHGQIRAVVNAASFVQNRSLTPGAIVSIFGKNLASTTAAASDPAQMPVTLGGTSVDVGGVPCVLFYVSPTQVNAQISPNTPVGSAALRLYSAGDSPAMFRTAIVTIEAAGAPGLFSDTASGTRDGAILNAVTFERGPFTVTTLGQPSYLAIYATGLDLSAPPVVTIGGVPVRVDFWGNAPGFVGLQQINVELPPSLAGAGRVEVAVTAGGKTSNIVEVVILPNVGEGPFGPAGENQYRHRELASLAWVPGTHLALLADENDDVIRVVDILQRTVIQTLTLPEGAEPVAVAADPSGTLAVVAERDRAKVAIIDLSASPRAVVAEVDVDPGPGSIAIDNNIAAIVSQDADSVSLINLATRQRTAILPVGRGPRYADTDTVTHRAYITNQDDGTISVIDLAAGAVIDTIDLGAETRPYAVQVIPGRNFAVVTEPSKRKEGRVMLVDLTKKTVVMTADANPERSGGSSDVAVYGEAVYFANQSGGSVTVGQLPLGSTAFTDMRAVKVDLGARALAVDVLDKLLLVTNQGSGTIVLVSLQTNSVLDRINGVRGEHEADGQKHDDQADRDEADNRPTIASITPNKGGAGTSFTIEIAGANLKGATGLAFIDPASVSGNGMGHGNDKKGKHAVVSDPKITVTGTQVDAAGTKLVATVAIAGDAAKGDRIVRVLTPNGESSLEKSVANTFTVE